MPSQQMMSISDVAAEYERAKSDTEKRDVVIRAIDANLVHVRMPVVDMFEIFRISPKETAQGADSTDRVEVINFSAVQQGPPGVAPQQFGWYMVVTHDGKTVWSYYLSDAHGK